MQSTVLSAASASRHGLAVYSSGQCCVDGRLTDPQAHCTATKLEKPRVGACLPGSCRLPSTHYWRTSRNASFDMLAGYQCEAHSAASNDHSPELLHSSKRSSKKHIQRLHQRQMHCPVAVACRSRNFVCPEREVTRQLLLQGACYGCGLGLQTLQPGAAGYVTQEKYATRLQHRHLNKLLCERCQELSNGHMVPAVEDFSSRNLSGQGAIV